MTTTMPGQEDEVIELTELMRKSTKQVHDKSDRLVNLKLAFVLTSRKLYGEALGLFAPIFERLESAVERNKHTKPFDTINVLLQSMTRTQGFKADLLFYLGAEGADTTHKNQKELPELQEYLDHLDNLERENPIYLIPYIYHMYMAIFAGGYLIRKMVKKAMGLTSDEGVQALSFSSEVDTRTLRTRFKQCVNDELHLSEEQQKRFLEESSYLFASNNKLVATIHHSRSFNEIMTIWTRRCQALFVVSVALGFAYYRRQKITSI